MVCHHRTETREAKIKDEAFEKVTQNIREGEAHKNKFVLSGAVKSDPPKLSMYRSENLVASHVNGLPLHLFFFFNGVLLGSFQTWNAEPLPIQEPTSRTFIQTPFYNSVVFGWIPR